MPNDKLLEKFMKNKISKGEHHEPAQIHRCLPQHHHSVLLMGEQGTYYGFGPYKDSILEMENGEKFIDARYYDGFSSGVTHVLELDPQVEIYWNQTYSVTFALLNTRHHWGEEQMIHRHSQGGPAIIDSRFGRTYSLEEHAGPAPVSLYSLLEPMPV